MRESAKAAQAFRDYVALGADRSLEALATKYRTSTEPAPTRHLRTLKGWSSEFGWQQRIANAATAATERMLETAAELDAEAFLGTSRILNKAVSATLAGKTDLTPADIVRIREAVRKPKERADVAVNVNLDDYVNRVAHERGLTRIEREALKKKFRDHAAKKGSLHSE